MFKTVLEEEKAYKRLNIIKIMRKIAANLIIIKALDTQLKKQYLGVDEIELCDKAIFASKTIINILITLKKQVEEFLANIQSK